MNETDISQKYKQKLEQALSADVNPTTFTSKEYRTFREESLPAQANFYEKLAKFSGSILKIKVADAKRAELVEALRISHLHITPEEANAASFVIPSIIMLVGCLTSLIFFGSLYLTFFFLFSGIALISIFSKLPYYLATNWRMKASNQMVLCVFYVVTYMRHTSNIERAIDFASEHLSPPLSLDMKRVIWDFANRKFNTIRDSLDNYLITWKDYNKEFVESFHLIESSLYETSEERRLSLLDKSLDVMLDETYEKMLHYAQNLKSPITILYMLGIILPILGLVVLPLVVSFMPTVQWWHIAILYNIVLPVVVYFMGKNILSKRPTGYGDTDISEINPALKKYKNVLVNIAGHEIAFSPMMIAVLVGGIMMFIGLLPVIVHFLNSTYDISLPLGFKFLDYHMSTATEGPNVGQIVGPFGLGASLLSMLIPLSFAFAFGLYYKLRSQNVLKIRQETNKLEDEFASALFQLGNRLGDGIPAEMAFEKVASVLEDTVSGQFFRLVVTNIRKLGMGLQDALFNSKSGAVVYFPSAIIHSSMKVLTESVKKGPLIAAQAVLNVSRYIKEIHKVTERLRDLMADILSDMKSQIHFLTPTIAGIVIGITSMITTILGSLTTNIQGLNSQGPEVASRLGGLSGIFGDGIPTFYFQIIVGLYVVQIVYVLTIMVNGIENGADKLNEEYTLGQNLLKSSMLYTEFGLVIMLVYNIIANTIISKAITG